jgi:hypothetical protein
MKRFLPIESCQRSRADDMRVHDMRVQDMRVGVFEDQQACKSLKMSNKANKEHYGLAFSL